MASSDQSKYAELAYWNERYATASRCIDMHASYDDIKGTLTAVAKKSGRILVPGCGNSPFSGELYQAGFRNQISLDFCPKVVGQMQIKYPHLQYLVGNALNMSGFVNCYFDTIVDKALLDTMSCQDNTNEAQNLYLNEVFRLLVPGGIFLCVSIQAEDVVAATVKAVFGKCVRCYPLGKPSGASDINRVVLVCRKPLHAVDSTVERIQRLISMSKTGQPETTIERIRRLARENRAKAGVGEPVDGDDDDDGAHEEDESNDDNDEDESNDDDDDDDDESVAYSDDLTLPTSERYKIELRKLFRKEPEACKPYLDPEYWESFGRVKGEEGASTMGVTDEGPGIGIDLHGYKDAVIVAEEGRDAGKQVKETIAQRGFCMVRSFCGDGEQGDGRSGNSGGAASSSGSSSADSSSGGRSARSAALPRVQIDWASRRHLLKRIADAIDALKAAGWPPAFVFMFDEPWQIIDGLFDMMEPVLGEDCVLDASVFAWGLDRGNRAEHVGGNFKLPHRDACFSNVNDEDGRPTNLSVWMCINEVTLDNGCMYVVPKDTDPLFADEESAYHMCSAMESKSKPGLDISFNLDTVLPLPGPPGSVLAW